MRYDFIKNNNQNSLYDFNAFGITEQEYKALEQLRDNRKHQRQKIKHHINFLMDSGKYDLYFITFTYDTNKHDYKNNWCNFRRTILRYVGDYVDDIILNVDYGELHERMHAHGIIAIDKNKPHTEYLQTFEIKHRKGKGKRFKTCKSVMTDYLYKYSNNVGHLSTELIEIKVKDKKISLDKLKEYTKNRISNYMNKLCSHSLKINPSYITTKKGTLYQCYKSMENLKKRICLGFRYTDSTLNLKFKMMAEAKYNKGKPINYYDIERDYILSNNQKLLDIKNYELDNVEEIEHRYNSEFKKQYNHFVFLNRLIGQDLPIFKNIANCLKIPPYQVGAPLSLNKIEQ